MPNARWSMAAALLAAVGTSSLVYAADDKPKAAAAKKVSKKAQQRYRAALKAGRAKLKQNDAKGAVASFEAALKAVPDDARALSELGWAAFKAGDLAKARQATDRSIASAGDAKLRAASLYNLGRILEAEGKKPEAIEPYRRSLALRPNATVRDRLVALDPAAKPDEPIAPAALAGPYPSLDAYCAAFTKEQDEPCVLDRASAPKLPELKLEAPYRELAVLLTGYDQHCTLAIRTGAGWFIDEYVTECREMGGHWERFVDVEAAALRDLVAGGAKELTLELETSEWFNETPEDAADDEMVVTNEKSRWLMVCGVGASGTPSCTPTVLVSWSRDENEGFALEPRFDDGAVVLRVKQGGSHVEGSIGVLGKHPLRFP
jgi:Tetratricopeptide repeat